MSDSQRIEHLIQFRDAALREMAEADLEFSRRRMEVERMESDMRIGRPEAPEYAETKGRLFPQSEARVLDAYREVLKLEEKINLTRGKG